MLRAMQTEIDQLKKQINLLTITERKLGKEKLTLL
jgi:hypothetical protein